MKVLIAEDEASLRSILKKLFEQKGYEVEVASDGEMAVHKLTSGSYHVALLDLNMPKKSGFEVLSFVKEQNLQTLVIIITAQDTMKNAVEAMKQGAYDYITKPFELDEIELVVEKALANIQLVSEVKALKEEKLFKTEPQAKMIGRSKSMQELYKAIGRVAASDVAVLISGESGVGKELVARSIHSASHRASLPFVSVNCAAIPKELLESELFGYRKGAFTGADHAKEGYFEAAHKGTLFLDEIGDMPLPLQAKLLRVLQEKEIYRLGSTEAKPIDVRIISASNQHLEKLVEEKKFREDLFFRLNVVPIHIPSLRERKEDIEVLVDYFLKRFQNELHVDTKYFSSEAMEILKKHAWPGNVRELENLVKRLLVMSSSQLIPAIDVENILNTHSAVSSMVDLKELNLEEMIEAKIAVFLDRLDSLGEMNLYEMMIARMEKPLISLLLKKTKGNQIQTAKVLGINRNTLRKMIRKLKIPIPRPSYEVEEEEI